MKEIVVSTWCDRCFSRDEARVPGETVGPITLPSLTRTLDCCPVCRKELLGELSELLAEKGVRATNEDLTATPPTAAQQIVRVTAVAANGHLPDETPSAIKSRQLEQGTLDLGNDAAPSPAVVVAGGKPRTTTAGNQAARWECPFCSEDMRRGSAQNHLWHKHISFKRPPLPTKCLDCNAYPPKGTKSSSTGLALHRRSTHGYDPMAEALALAEKGA